MSPTRYFTAATFAFLRDLARNNDRVWFKENKPRYEEHVKEPALAFITDFEPHLKKISRHFRADASPVGGSLFRIHRDTRFSRDKSPYKTHTGIQFRHEAGKDAHTPGFYLHLQPREIFVGCGIWHPDSAALAKIRDAIVADPAGWKHASRTASFGQQYTLSGEVLKRPPRGFDPTHPMIEDLKRKDFIGVKSLTQKEVTDPGFLASFASMCRAATPFQRFLCGALDVEY